MAIKVFTILVSIDANIPVFLSDSCSSSSFTFSQSISGKVVVETVVIITSVVASELVVTAISFVATEIVCVVVNSVVVVVSTILNLGELMIFQL